MDENFRVSHRLDEGVAILSIHGNITGLSEAELTQAYREVLDGGADKLILDLEGVDYINSAGIAVLIELFLKSQKGNQRIVIAGLKDYFRKIFRMVGLTKFTTLYDSVEDARASF